jgi:hypothetical protein
MVQDQEVGGSNPLSNAAAKEKSGLASFPTGGAAETLADYIEDVLVG